LRSGALEETDAEHEAHGSPAAALEAHVDDDGNVEGNEEPEKTIVGGAVDSVKDWWNGDDDQQ